jgi:hypothetical protein
MKRIAILLSITLFALLFSSVETLAQQTLTVTPNRAVPSRTVELHGNGFTPGTASILWDGEKVQNFIIPPSRTFTIGFTIPSRAAAGSHTVSVCWGSPCASGEFDERASAEIEVIPLPPPPAGDFDIEILAVEVTQGVRGNIPTSSKSPSGGLELTPDNTMATHVANRRTIVRVYPSISIDAGGGSPQPITATMSGSRGGAALPGEPVIINPWLRADPTWSLNAMRADASKSWIFMLPESWTTPGTINLTISVNPPGEGHRLECRGCDDDNRVVLNAVEFKEVQTENIKVRLYQTEVFWRNASGAIQRDMPSSEEIASMMNAWIKSWPIDPDKVRLSWRRGQQSLPVGGVPPSPPIPGIPSDSAFINGVRSENTDRDDLRPNPYLYIPLIRSIRSPQGCGGMAGIGGPPDFTGGACDPIMRHEAAHTIGLTHSGNPSVHGGIGSNDPRYPDPHGALEPRAYGFDIWNLQAIPPTGSVSHTHDFMLGVSTPPDWVSIYTWEKLADAFGTSDLSAGGISSSSLNVRSSQYQDFINISGWVDAQNNVTFDASFQPMLSTISPALQGVGDYSIQVRNNQGFALFTLEFEPYQMHTHVESGNDENLVSFFETIPVLEGMTEIALMRGSQDLGSMAVSSSSPTVFLVSPKPNENWAAQGNLKVEWNGNDNDSPSLSYRLEASPDGINWYFLTETTDTRAEINLADVPGSGSNWRVRVQASDGVNVAIDEVSGIQIAPKSPEALMISPLNDDTFVAGAPIELFGLVADVQDDEIPDGNIEWFIDGDSVGSGRRLSVVINDIGEHVILMSVKNSAGLSGNMSSRISTTNALSLPGIPGGPGGGAESAAIKVYDLNNNDRIDEAELIDILGDWIINEVDDNLFSLAIDLWQNKTAISRANSAAIQGVNSAFAIKTLSLSNRGYVFAATGRDIDSMDVTVYSLDGKQIFQNESRSGTLIWNLRDDVGRPVANGVYLVRISAHGASGWSFMNPIKKVVVLR